MDKRSFTILSVNDKRRSKGADNIGGSYISSTPAGAARKAGTRICRKSAIRGQCTLKICVAETTNGFPEKVFCYKVKRVVVNNLVNYNGKQVMHKYKTNAKKFVEKK